MKNNVLRKLFIKDLKAKCCLLDGIDNCITAFQVSVVKTVLINLSP